MGKTPKPLTILLHPDLQDWEEFKFLRDQGHIIEVGTGFEQPDIILGPNAHWMDEELRHHLDLTIKSAQRRKYGKEKHSVPS